MVSQKHPRYEHGMRSLLEPNEDQKLVLSWILMFRTSWLYFMQVNGPIEKHMYSLSVDWVQIWGARGRIWRSCYIQSFALRTKSKKAWEKSCSNFRLWCHRVIQQGSSWKYWGDCIISHPSHHQCDRSNHICSERSNNEDESDSSTEGRWQQKLTSTGWIIIR